MENVNNIAIDCIYFFVIGAFLGWLLECVFKAVTKNYERTPGILNTPFCILYGVGTLFLSKVIYYVTDNFWGLFLLSFVILSSIEYLTFVLLQRIYGIRLWDYNNMSLNINGKVCVEFSLIWGILGALYIKVILPILNYVLNNANRDVLNFSVYTLLTIIAVDFLVSSITLLKNKRKYIKSMEI